MYQICAVVQTTVTANGTEWHGQRSAPTFYLDERVQGIVSAEHAENIARGVLDPTGTIAASDIAVTAYKTPDETPGIPLMLRQQAAELLSEYAEACISGDESDIEDAAEHMAELLREMCGVV